MVLRRPLRPLRRGLGAVPVAVARHERLRRLSLLSLALLLTVALWVRAGERPVAAPVVASPLTPSGARLAPVALALPPRVNATQPAVQFLNSLPALNQPPKPVPVLDSPPQPLSESALAQPAVGHATATRTRPDKKPVSTPASHAATLPLNSPSLPAVRAAPSPSLSHHEYTVRAGDSLSTLADPLGVSPATVHDIVSLNADTAALRRIIPGQRLHFALDEQDQLQTLRWQLTGRGDALVVQREDGRFVSAWQDVSVEMVQQRRAGVIEHSLYRAGQRAGLSEHLVMELAGIFAWDVDFLLDVRPGDSFSVLYERPRRGKPGRETILAAQFNNRGRVLQAVRHVDATGRVGYFTPAGQAMRRAFVRTPVSFTRISSRFDLRRRHPILNRIRAHRGVDYAAPTGTPVQATGDGVIEFVGRKGQYGRTVLIRHAGRYHTLYAHLSRYAKGLTRGQRVRQGQRIGYVGQSGLATGPHLHYEFRVQGVHRDPLKVELPRAASVSKQSLADFKAHTAPLLAALEGEPGEPESLARVSPMVRAPAPGGDG